MVKETKRVQKRDKIKHILEMEVRDYECDYQGVVNNAVYQNYLEHARHSAIKQYFSVPKLSQQGIHLVVAEIQLQYLQPLKPQQLFTIHSTFAQKGLFRLICEQELYRAQQLVLKAKVYIAALENGKPCSFARVSQICGYDFTQDSQN